MATVQMGAIITKIAGSIGGTNFRRQRATTVMSNKTAGGSKNKLRQNSALPQMVATIRNWSLLSQADRDAWAVQATNYQFPDKFGNMRNLTGRQLYIKLQSSATFGGYGVVNPNLLDSNVPSLTGLTIESFLTFEIQLTFNEIVNNCTLLLSYEFLKNGSISPTFKRRKIYSKLVAINDSGIDGPSNILDFYPSAQNGDKFRVYVQAVNPHGFKGQVSFVDTTLVIAP